MKQVLSLISALPTLDLPDQRVFLRADLNVPVKDGRITNDYRLTALKPTLDLLLARGCSIVLATHRGRPVGINPSLSTKVLIPWFKEHGYTISHEANLAAAREKSYTLSNSIVLLENLRFFPGEKDHDAFFAQQLALLGDYYVNDAFGLLHRNDTSITLVPALFAPEKRTIGLLIEKELSMLSRLVDNPEHPFVLCIGGGKVVDKLPLLYTLLDKVDMILLCPAVVCTFLQALGDTVGNSLVDTTSINECKKFLEDARAQGVTIMFPDDYQIAESTFFGSLSITDTACIPDGYVALSVGPKTSHTYAEIIRSAKTVFFNGLPGDINRRDSLQGVAPLFEAAGASTGLSVIGGGDSVAAAELLHYTQHISYLSTGGGATLAYLAGQLLPGLYSFIPRNDG